MSRILRRKKRGPVRAKKKVVDGIEFKSGLEAYMYTALNVCVQCCTFIVACVVLLSFVFVIVFC